ncbi:hypothetical protein G6F63_016162 [Rhizopus arrhizus]|nr:hypothetical protein G6F63_016162 [Rhizopus arrhizus]
MPVPLPTARSLPALPRVLGWRRIQAALLPGAALGQCRIGVGYGPTGGRRLRAPGVQRQLDLTAAHPAGEVALG